MFTFVAFDTETTGTSLYNDEIVEIGAVKFMGGKPKEGFGKLVKPSKSIPAGATKIHGITNEMVKDQASLELVLSEFSDFCGDAVLVAHNAPFDVKFLGSAGEKHNVRLPGGVVLDTYAMSKTVLSELFNHRLGTLVKHFQIDSKGFHRAEEDASYCGQVFIHMLRLLKEKNKDLSFQNIINLSGGLARLPEIKVQAKQLGLL